MGPLTDRKLEHSKAVAEFLYYRTSFTEERDEMYIMGLLHDIGYLHKKNGHAKEGGLILKELGYRDWQVIAEHGNPNSHSFGKKLDELNWADLQIDNHGNLVGFNKRLEGIKAHHGERSSQYSDALRIVEDLLAKGFPDVGAENYR